MGEGEISVILEKREPEPTAAFPNLLNMSNEEEERARKQIEKFGGLVRVMVHPYFDLDSSDGFRIDDYLKPLQKLLCSKSAKKPPIIFLEEGGAAYRDMQGVLAKRNLQSTENGVYLVPTYRGYPTPDV